MKNIQSLRKRKPLAKKLVSLLLSFLLLISQFLPPFVSYVYSASSPWAQSDWSGGSGQTSWVDSTKFSSSSNVATSTPSEITLTPVEKFTNTGFETDLSNWSGTQSYTLDDEFSDTVAAGSVNNTSANPGPGTRTAVDTNSKISVGSGTLNFATGEATNDGVWYGNQTRTAGKFLTGIITPSDTNGIPALGWDTNTLGSINDALLLNTTIGLQVVPNGASAITVGSYTAATPYNIASVLRSTGTYWFIKGGAFTDWSLLWQTAIGTATGYPSIQTQNTASVFTGDSVHIPSTTWLPTPLAYDTFTRANGSMGVTETAGPDSQTTPSLAWTGGTWTVSSSNMLTNPGFETAPYSPHASWTESVNGGTIADETSTVHAGSHAIKLTYGSGSSPTFYQAVTVVPGITYNYSFWTAGDATNAGRYRVYDITNSANIIALTSTGITANSYSEVTGSFTAPAGCDSIQFNFYSPSSGTAYFDDITIYGNGSSANTPTLGGEAVTNSGFDTDTSWTKGTDWTIATGVLSATNVAQFSSTYQNSVVNLGTWYKYAFTVSSLSLGGGYLQEGANTIIKIFNSDNTYTGVFLSTTGGAIRIKADPVSTFNIDDVSIKPLTTSELFSSVLSSTANVIADVNITLTSGTQAGLVLNLDSTASPANFVIAYHDGTKAHLVKAVAGVYTSLIDTTTTYSAGAKLRVIKDGTNYSLYYNNTQVGTTQTIDDAGIIANTHHGLFSTHSGNSFSNFTLWARGNGGEYAAIPAGDLTTSRDTTIHYTGAASAKLVAAGNDANFTQAVNLGDTNTYNLSAYAYVDGSTPVTSSFAQLVVNGTLITTAFTSVGSGWYKLTGTTTGVASSIKYGIKIKAGKTVYVDDISLNSTSNGTLTSSIFDTGQASDWGTLTFSAVTPSNTSVSVKVRTSSDANMTGATVFSSCNIITSNTDISSNNCVTDSQRYVQYQVTLANTDNLSTPTFTSFSLSFTLSTIPSAPSGFSVTSFNTTSITWSWTDNATNERGFYVQDSSGNTKCTLSSPSSGTVSCTETGLTPNTTYTRQAVAYNGAGNSTATSTITQTTLALSTYYVSNSGSDSNSGTLSSPFQTIGQAIALANPGDIIYVKGGTYREFVNITRSGSSGYPITLQNYGNEAPVIDGTGVSVTEGLLQAGGDYITISGFIIQHSTDRGFYNTGSNNILENSTISYSYNHGAYIYLSTNVQLINNEVYENVQVNYPEGSVANWPQAVTTWGSTDTIFKNNRVHNNHGEGMTSSGNSTGTQFIGNVIHDNWSVNIYIDTTASNLVDRNFIYNTTTTSYGIELADEGYGQGCVSQNNRISNNIIINVSSGIAFWKALSCSGLVNDTFENNTIYNSINYAVNITSGSHSNTVFRNNIFYEDRVAATGLLKVENPGNTSFDTNLIYDPSGSTQMFNWDGTLYNFTNWETITPNMADNIWSDPLFFNKAGAKAADYQVIASSPAVDVGITPTTAHDYDNNARLIDGKNTGTPLYDIGAYEYQRYRVAINRVDISGNVRIFADGTFMNTDSPSGTTADLSITPAAGFTSGDISTWMNISITDWGTNKTWTESSTIGQISTLHTIGDLTANTSYKVTIDGVLYTTTTSNNSGKISFTYTGGYSTHTFNVTKSPDAGGAPGCTTTSPSGPTPWLYEASANNGTSITLRFTNWQTPIDHFALEYGTSPDDYQYAADNVGGQNTTSYTVNFLNPNTTYYFRVRTGNGCATGSWSNKISARTKSLVTSNSLNIVSSEFAPVGKSETNTQRYYFKIKVVDTKGNPISGVNVTLHSTPRQITTNENGIAEFSNVEPGQHEVLIVYDGYEGKESINLTGNVKEFELTIKVKKENILLSPQAIAIIGIMAIIIATLTILLIKARKRASLRQNRQNIISKGN